MMCFNPRPWQSRNMSSKKFRKLMIIIMLTITKWTKKLRIRVLILIFFSIIKHFLGCIKLLHFNSNPIKIGHLVPEIWLNLCPVKKKKKKKKEQKNKLPLFPYISKSIFSTSDSFLSYHVTYVYLCKFEYQMSYKLHYRKLVIEHLKPSCLLT